MLLKELKFCNLQVRLDKREKAIFTYRDGGPDQGKEQSSRSFLNEPCYPVPDEYDDEIETLVKAINEGPERAGINVGGLRLRVTIEKNTYGGAQWASCRLLSSNPIDLDKLGFTPKEIALFRSWAQGSGLVIFAGKMAAGKTTSWNSFLVDTLKSYGGGAHTIENPIEIVFQGRVGQYGHALQVEAINDEDMIGKIDKALSFNPRYIGVGEMTSGLVACKVFQVANAGHLVASTSHGDSIAGAIQNYIQRAAEIVDYRQASTMLSRVITGVVVQKKINGRMYPTFFDVAGAQDEQKIREAMASMNWSGLQTIIEAQVKRNNALGTKSRAA